MPTGLLMPVESMSMRALIGIVQAFDTPGNCNALSISAIRETTVTPGRHSALGFRRLTVPSTSVGAGAGAVEARRAGQDTRTAQGNADLARKDRRQRRADLWAVFEEAGKS